jgi:hypothetical protein
MDRSEAQKKLQDLRERNAARRARLWADLPRFLMHCFAFALGSGASAAVNALVVVLWYADDRPLMTFLPSARFLLSFAFAILLPTLAFYGSALPVSRAKTYRPNRRFGWSMIAGLLYGVGVVWVFLAAILWLPDWAQTPPGKNPQPDTPSWGVLGLIVWSLYLLPTGLSRVFSRRIREVRPGCGLCPNCEYDMRESPERCPECGHLSPKPAPSASGDIALTTTRGD